MGVKIRFRRFCSFWVFPLLSAALLALTYHGSRQLFLDSARFVATGLVMWTLLEYIFHRFLLHAEFDNPKLDGVANASHLQHHASPRNPDKIFVQLPFALVTSSLMFVAIYAVTRDGFQTSAIMSGIWLGFLYYECVHYRVHISLAHSALLQRQRRAHFYHHFSNSKQCFGVTSPLWDYVFGTSRREVRQI